MAFGTIIVKDSNGNIRKFTPNFDISQYITKQEVTDIINELPVAISDISGEFSSGNSAITITYVKTNNETDDIEINLSNLLPTAVVNKIEDYAGGNINNINPTVGIDDETNEPTLYLELIRNNDESEHDVVSVSLKSLMEDFAVNIPEFTPATDEDDGAAGLVPSVISSQVDHILTGGGWKSVDEIGLITDLSASNFKCTFDTVRKAFSAGIFFFDGNGNQIKCEEIVANLRASETFTQDIEVVSSNRLIGCGFSYPYNNLIPSTAELRTFEYFQDLECWDNDRVNNHYTVTFSDGFTLDANIESVNLSTFTIKVSVYGPKANSPRQFFLNVDGNVSSYYYKMLDDETRTYDINASVISVYQRTSENTQLYSNEDISELTPVELSDTPYTNSYLPLEFIRTETGISVKGKEIDISNWRTELLDAKLHIVQTQDDGGQISNDVSMNCLGGYVSNSLAQIDDALASEAETRANMDNAILQQIESITASNVTYAVADVDISGSCVENEQQGQEVVPQINITITGTDGQETTKSVQIPEIFDVVDDKIEDAVNNIPAFTGATTDANGNVGFVPAPQVADKDKFLKGDGTWEEVDLSSIALDLQAETTARQNADTALSNRIDAIETVAGTAYHFKGSVADVTLLPSENNTVGDVWNIGTSLNGDNYAWTGTNWDKLGGTIDLSAYALDSTVVHNTGDETIAGTKTFTSDIAGNITGNATTATNATNATNDGNGNNIADTYATKDELEALPLSIKNISGEIVETAISSEKTDVQLISPTEWMYYNSYSNLDGIEFLDGDNNTVGHLIESIEDDSITFSFASKPETLSGSIELCKGNCDFRDIIQFNNISFDDLLEAGEKGILFENNYGNNYFEDTHCCVTLADNGDDTYTMKLYSCNTTNIVQKELVIEVEKTDDTTENITLCEIPDGVKDVVIKYLDKEKKIPVSIRHSFLTYLNQNEYNDYLNALNNNTDTADIGTYSSAYWVEHTHEGSFGSQIPYAIVLYISAGNADGPTNYYINNNNRYPIILSNQTENIVLDNETFIEYEFPLIENVGWLNYPNYGKNGLTVFADLKINKSDNSFILSYDAKYDIKGDLLYTLEVTYDDNSKIEYNIFDGLLEFVTKSSNKAKDSALRELESFSNFMRDVCITNVTGELKCSDFSPINVTNRVSRNYSTYTNASVYSDSEIKVMKNLENVDEVYVDICVYKNNDYYTNYSFTIPYSEINNAQYVNGTPVSATNVERYAGTMTYSVTDASGITNGLYLQFETITDNYVILQFVTGGFNASIKLQKTFGNGNVDTSNINLSCLNHFLVDNVKTKFVHTDFPQTIDKDLISSVYEVVSVNPNSYQFETNYSSENKLRQANTYETSEQFEIAQTDFDGFYLLYTYNDEYGNYHEYSIGHRPDSQLLPFSELPAQGQSKTFTSESYYTNAFDDEQVQNEYVEFFLTNVDGTHYTVRVVDRCESDTTLVTTVTSADGFKTEIATDASSLYGMFTEFRGATTDAPGVPGLVPEALSSDKDKFLKGDGTWATPSGIDSLNLEISCTPINDTVEPFEYAQTGWVTVTGESDTVYCLFGSMYGNSKLGANITNSQIPIDFSSVNENIKSTSIEIKASTAGSSDGWITYSVTNAQSIDIVNGIRMEEDATNYGLSGITPLTENNKALYVQAVDNNGTTILTFSVKPIKIISDLTADLVATNTDRTSISTDLKPLLSKIGGTVIEKPTSYDSKLIIYSCRLDICGFSINGNHVGEFDNVSTDNLVFEVPDGGNVYLFIGDPDKSTINSFYGILTTQNEVPVSIDKITVDGGLRLYTFGETSNETVSTDYFLFARVVDEEYPDYEPLNDNYHLYQFTLKKAKDIKQVLNLEPSCDTDIDLSPVFNTVNSMIDDSKIKEVSVTDTAPVTADDLDYESIIIVEETNAQGISVTPVYTTTDQVIDGVKKFNAGIFGGVSALSGNVIDVTTGTCFTKTITANTTFSFSNAPANTTCCVTLILTNGGNYVVSWDSSIKWSDNEVPTLSTNAQDVLTFITYNGGTTWYGTHSMKGITV